MMKLKEAVKTGQLTASEALEDLRLRALDRGDIPYVYQTRTWKWLKRRIKDAVV